MMALLLPQWAPPESLVDVRQRQRSRKSARAIHGAPETSASPKSFSDHFQISSSGLSGNMISSLVLPPRKPMRGSSRLAAWRGSGDDVTPSDRDAAEWINRVLDNNGVVEVDPVTMAEQIHQSKYHQAKSSSSNNPFFHFFSSSDGYPARSSGFNDKVPLAVAIAAGLAVAWALIALIQASNKESSSSSSDSNGSNLSSSFKGTKPASLSEVGKPSSKPKYESVTPFFASDRSATSYAKPAPPPATWWKDDKYKSVRPFFADEVTVASAGAVASFFPDEQKAKSENGQSSSNQAPVTGSKTPSSPYDQSSTNGPSLETVAPFFPDELPGRNSAGVSPSEGPVKAENVKPFFPDEQVGTSSPGKRGSMWSQFWDGKSGGGGGARRDSGNQVLAGKVASAQGQRKEIPEVGRALSSDELALLDDIKTEEEKRFAKMQALQAAFPALAIGAGAVGALVGVDGAFEMVGITATASFISYELLWANKRKELVDEISSITDHNKLFSFLQKRKIVKDDC